MLLAACSSAPKSFDAIQDSSPKDVPVDPWSVPEPAPRAEPKSRYGNPASYEVFGKRYHVLDSAKGYKERGHASWYGTKFHGRRTSSGEPYDMFALTAAHKTLPLPSYVRVTNLDNGRSLVVKVNDRGPFHPGRIIDLSYTAAVRLGVYQAGFAPVEVVALSGPGLAPPRNPAPEAVPDTEPDAEPDALGAFLAELESRATEAAPEPMPFLELGAFRKMSDCERQRSHLAEQQLLALTISSDADTCRVLQGPFATPEDANAQAMNLRDKGLNPTVSYR